MIALNEAGKITFSSHFARVLVEKYFGGEPLAANLLPQTLAAWVQRALNHERLSEYKLPVAPLRLGRPDGRLTVRLLDSRSTREEILLLEETKALSPESFVPFGLTRRESEVLYWVTEGKGDADIAVLCGISIRTVQKHVENVYRKLGVETRTAAMNRARELVH